MSEAGPLLDPPARAGFVLGLAALSALLSWAVGRARLVPDAVRSRSNHTVPTSRAGGAAVLAVFAGAVGVVFALGGAESGALGLFAAVVGAGLIGLADDLLSLPPLVKLGGLTVTAALAAGSAGPVDAVPLPVLGWLSLPGGLGYAVAALWVLGFVNVFNFLDGLNGMAAATGVVLLAGIAVLSGQGAATLPLAMTGALLGFALPNVLGGRPFLGDAGSLSVGTMIAGGALMPGGQAVWIVVCGAVPFLADAALTLARRAREGASLMQAHSEHAYQRLHRAGW